MISNKEAISLKEYIETLIKELRENVGIKIDERDRLYDTRFKAAEVAVNAALAAQEKAVTAAFLASEKAIVKAEDAQKDYNQRSNEFRGQLDDQAKTLMPRIETIGLFKAADDKGEALRKDLEGKIDFLRLSSEKIFEGLLKELGNLRESRSESSGKGAGLNAFWGYLIGVMGLIATIFAIGSRFVQ